MKRFIRYLYEYENGKRIRNVGFVKVEENGDQCIMNIYGKGLRLESRNDIELYVFYRKGDACIGIPQGKIEHINPTINYRLKFDADDVGGSEKFGQIEGVILSNYNKPRYASMRNDISVDISGMIVEKIAPKVVQSAEEMGKSMEEETAQVSSAPLISPQGENSGGEIPGSGAASGNANTGTVNTGSYVAAAEESAARNDTAQVPPGASQPESGGNPKYRKIKREDMAKLPRKEWFLANNSFLLHGYGNYHHLMLIQEGNALWLGVPGVYHEKEKAAAEAFGFPRFIEVTVDIELAEDEMEEDKFGYWSRQVSQYQV